MALVNGSITNMLQHMNPNQFNNNPDLDRVWFNYNYDRLEETNNLYKSGIISQSHNAEDRLMQSGNGLSIAIPHITAIDASLRPQKWNSSTDIVGNDDGQTYVEREIKLTQSQSYNFSTYDEYVTGIDQQTNIPAQMNDYWGHVDEKQLINTIECAFLNQQIKDAKGFHLGDAATGGTAKQLSAQDFMAANARMGDNNTTALNKIVINSAVWYFMRSQNVIQYINLPSSSAGPIATYNGFQIVLDDEIPVQPDGTTTMYIFGGGAVDYVTAPAPNAVSLTQDHNEAGGVTQLTQKRIVVCHVQGTDVDYAAAQAKGYNEQNWDDAIWNADAPIYKPVNGEDLRDIKLVKYNFTIPKEFRVAGVNTPDANGNLGDDGYGQHKKSSNSSNSSKGGSSNSSSSKSSK